MRNDNATRYVRCLGCRTVYASPRASRASRFAWLDQTFTPSPSTFTYVDGRRAVLNLEAELLKGIKRHGNLLDVGCCTGGLFEFFSEQHWQRYGIEMSRSAAAYASKTYGAQVHAGTLQTADFPLHHFDIITMIDMFYYVDDPRSELLKIAQLIRPDGLLAIEIPGQSYMLARSRGPLCLLSSGKWTRLNTDSSYLYWYTAQSLSTLLSKSGFRVISFVPIAKPSGTENIQFVANPYYSIAGQASRHWRYLLNWTPKYLCLATPDRQISSSPPLPIDSPRVATISSSMLRDYNVVDFIRHANTTDASSIATLHNNFIANTSSFLSGSEHSSTSFIETYYNSIISNTDCSVYVALNDNKTIGYASLVRNQRWIILSMIFNKCTFSSVKKLRYVFPWRIVRYIIAKMLQEILGGKWSSDMKDFRDSCELRAVAVDPGYRSLSIGTGLLRASLAHARLNNWGRVIAWIEESNLPSRRLFEKAGFVKVGEKMEMHGCVYLYASPSS